MPHNRERGQAEARGYSPRLPLNSLSRDPQWPERDPRRARLWTGAVRAATTNKATKQPSIPKVKLNE